MLFRVIGPGRAGKSFRRALGQRGWICVDTRGRGDRLDDAARGVSVVVLAVPDGAIASVAQDIRPDAATLLHLSGATGLDALAPHERRASVHPLVSLPDPETGSRRLLDNAVFAIAGGPVAAELVETLGGRPIRVPDDQRATYHAAAAIASNHLVALCAQVERLAVRVGIPADAYWEMMDRTLNNVAQQGAAASLTGPAARGDQVTLRRHLDAIGPDEAVLYRALADAAATLAGKPPLPDDR